MLGDIVFTESGNIVVAEVAGGLKDHPQLICFDDRLTEIVWSRPSSVLPGLRSVGSELYLLHHDGSLERVDDRTGKTTGRWSVEPDDAAGDSTGRQSMIDVDVTEGEPRWVVATRAAVSLHRARDDAARLVRRIARPEDARTLVAAHGGTTYVYWNDGPGLGTVRRFDLDGEEYPQHLAIGRVWIDDRYGLMVNRGREVHQLDREDGTVVAYHEGLVRNAGPNGHFVELDRTRWSYFAGDDEIELPKPDNWYSESAISNSGNTFAVRDHYGRLRVWNRDGAVLLDNEQFSGAVAMTLTDEVLWVFVPRGLHRFDLAHDELLSVSNGGGTVYRLPRSAERGCLAYYQIGKVVVVDDESLQPRFSVEATYQGGADFAMSPDGSRIVCWGRSVVLFDGDGQQVANLDGSRLAYGTAVRSRFSPDSRWLANAGGSRLRVYRAEDGELVIDSKGTVQDLAFDDEHGLLWVARDGRLERWSLPDTAPTR